MPRLDRKEKNRRYLEGARRRAKEEGFSLHRWRKQHFPVYAGIQALVRSARQRSAKRGIEFNITCKGLRSIYESQGGVCPFSRVILRFGPGLQMDNASIDRIDQSRGYVDDNIRLVCWWVNIARYTLSDCDFVAWCKAVANSRANDEKESHV